MGHDEMQVLETSAGPVEYTSTGAGPAVVLLHGLLMDHTVWDTTLPLLPDGYRYIRPVLPLGAHRRPMRPGADLTLPGQVRILAEVLDRLGLTDAALVHSDWGGGLFLTALGLDQRVGRQVILPSEAFDNFPPGLPGKMVRLAVAVPGGLTLAARQLRVGWLRRLPMLFGQMVRRPIPDELVRSWTAPLLSDPDVRRDLDRYARSDFAAAELITRTEALAGFTGHTLVLWTRNPVMPVAHGRRLSELIPNATYVEIPDAYVLAQLDAPAEVARAIGAFLTSTPAARAQPT